MEHKEIAYEVLTAMEPRINNVVQALSYEDRDDFRQDIKEKLFIASQSMKTMNFWEFKNEFEKNK